MTDVFSRLDYMERRGSGLKRIKESFKDKNFVEFYSNQSSFFVIMKNQTVDEIEDERLNENEKLIVEFLYKNEKITNKQVTDLTGFSPAQARRIFVSLQDKRLIEGRGNFFLTLPLTADWNRL